MEPVAILGMSFRFPGGAESPDDFWRMMVEKRCAAAKVPPDRFNVDAFWHADPKKQNLITTQNGHFLQSDIKGFDAGFFSMAPHEAGSMDPQQRAIMECTYHALENAGLRLQDVAGTRTSVHIGCFTSDFATMQFRDTQEIPKYNSLGTAGSMLANRISWFFDLHGESMYVDTACSSSMVALSLAHKGLISGESDVAVVGGSNIILIPEFSISLSNMSMLSPTGKCQSFDAKADGYGRGEGFAVLILKKLSRAITDGDPIRALIRSIGTNQDGRTSGGITQPSKDMQVQLIHETYRKAGLDMKHTRFFEAHGTGTPMGDPIEARAIGEAFFNYRSPDDPIYVGAVKSNVGHLEGASGLAGVVKTILALEKGIIPPNANYESLNPRIDAEFFNLSFPVENVAWPTGAEGIRRASVNSFGFGGSNCHIILEATDAYLDTLGHKRPQCLYLCKPHLSFDMYSLALTEPHTFMNGNANGSRDCRDLHKSDIATCVPTTNGYANGWTTNCEVATTTKEFSVKATRSTIDGNQCAQDTPKGPQIDQPKLLILSAADADGISRQAKSIQEALDRVRHWDRKVELFGDVVFNLNNRRSMLEWKAFGVLNPISLPSDLTKLISMPNKTSNGPNNIGLIFTGQGAQWPGMGRELLEWPVFKSSLISSQKHLASFGVTWSLIDEISADDQSSRVHMPEFSQTITTAIQIALVKMLKFVGMKPSLVIGHSSGEIAAAYCAGFLCHKSAMRVSYFRGLMASKLARLSATKPWGMASVGISAAEVPTILDELREQASTGFEAEITISCMNCPTNTTISGPIASLEKVVKYLESRQKFARKLKVDVGYHSPQMYSVSSEYLEHLSDLRQGEPLVCDCNMISSVEPGLATAENVCSGEYWLRNMMSPVRFLEAISFFCANSNAGGTTKLLDRSHPQLFVQGWLEVGPHGAMGGPLREILASHKRSESFYTSLLTRKKPANATVLEALGHLWCRGFQFDLRQVGALDAVGPRQPSTIVDLPEYPFNHSVTYWEESSRSRDFRNRMQPHHPLLGSPAMDWNPLSAKWRLTIKKTDLPWVSDHRLHGKIWYPAAGMITMAIEALKQLQSDGQFDFELQDVSFKAPIVVSDDELGTDMEIVMVPTSTAKGAKATEYKFRILVRRPDDSWDESCNGTISQYRTRQHAVEVNAQDEEQYKRQKAQAEQIQARGMCSSTIEASEMYQKVADKSGLQYGSSFQALRKIGYDHSGHAVADLMPLADEIAEVSAPFTIHPSTLDCIFQVSIPALSAGLSKSMPTLVPARLTRLWISRAGASHIASSDGALEPHMVYSRAHYTSRRSATSWATVFSQSSNKLVDLRVQVEELEMTEVAREDSNPNFDSGARSVSHEMVWKCDFALLNPEAMCDYCWQHRSPGPEPEEWFESMTAIFLGFAWKSFDALKQSGQEPVPSMRKYATWLQNRLDDFHNTHPGVLLPSGDKLQEEADHFAATSYRGALGVLVGRQLKEFLVGELDPLQTLFADPQSLADFYGEVNAAGKAFPMLNAYLDAMVHKDAGLRFLEIGAGTGATTSMILDMIAPLDQGPRYAEYMFTDISEYFFQSAQEKFKSYDRIQYCALDIENLDLNTQGPLYIDEGAYDVVVAANVLHATKDLRATLSNVRRLLKPGGKLVLLELTTPKNAFTGFVWGTLAGWWRGSEHFRQESAIVDETLWHELLEQTGFSGAEQVFRDWDSDVCHGWSLMVSSALPGEHLLHETCQTTSSLPSNLTLIIDNDRPDFQVKAAKNIQDLACVLKSHPTCDLILFDHLLTVSDEELGDRECILLVDLGRHHLQDMDEMSLKCYQRVLTTCKSVLWVQNYQNSSPDPPYAAMVEGLCRVVRNEHPFVRIVTLTLDSGVEEYSAYTVAAKTMKVLETMKRSTNLGVAGLEEEYLEQSGYFCIPRLIQAKYMDEHVHLRTQGPVKSRELGSGPSLCLNIRVPGLLDTLEWVEDKTVCELLQPDQVEIKVKAIGVNFKDCLTLLGRVNTDDIGSECSGLVTRVGGAVKSVEPGDRVAMASIGTYRSLMRAREPYIVRIPDSMSFEEAAAIPTAFLTAYYSLYKVGRLQRGETVLIHAAAGGTGQAAVQIAQHIGAEIFATVGSAGKRALLRERYGIPDDHIFFSRDSSFADGVRRMTRGRGVDVVLNSLSGQLLVASWEIIADFGRFVEIGRKDIDGRGFLPMFPFIKNAMFAGVDLAAMVDGPGQSHIHMLQDVFNMFYSGVLQPLYPIQPYPVDQAEHAFRLLVSGKSTGKVVLAPSDNTVIPFRVGEDSEYRFSGDATYVIAGGLGGIGRQITRWLARRGARHILLLTRSGTQQHPEKRKLISEMHALGVKVQHGICDITDLESVRKAVQNATLTMPPIKGCFQAAMVIQDRTFTAMTSEDWRAVIGPKVLGSWNIHTVLPSGMDFFIMLSSAVCIFGKTGQANYSAGNTFQDALARYRVSRGEKGVAIDLGMILDEGWVAERKHIQRMVMGLDQVLPVSQKDLFAILDYYCNPATTFKSPTASQLVTGIELPARIALSGRQIPDVMFKPLFSAMHQIMSSARVSGDSGAKVQNTSALFEQVNSLEAAGTVIAEALMLKLCKILGLEAASKTVKDSVDSFGIDSLIALEVRNWLRTEMCADVAVYEILGDGTLLDTGLAAAKKSELRQGRW